MTDQRMTSKSPAWCRTGCACGRQRGSAQRAQMRAYALAVAVALTGSAQCVHCGDTISLHRGEVDRVVTGCYRPGAVIMTCESCNNGAGQAGERIDRAAYAAAVAAASERVAIPSPTESVKAYKAGANIFRTIERSPFWRG